MTTLALWPNRIDQTVCDCGTPITVFMSEDRMVRLAKCPRCIRTWRYEVPRECVECGDEFMARDETTVLCGKLSEPTPHPARVMARRAGHVALWFLVIALLAALFDAGWIQIMPSEWIR